MMYIKELINGLESGNNPTDEELVCLLRSDGDDMRLLTEAGRRVRERVYGKDIFIRGLIEISSFCKNDCYYCGIRRSNKNAQRYRLTPEQIIECAEAGYRLGFRTFVLQGGEDMYFTDDVLCGVIKKIKALYPDCAVTVSMGERSYESYKRLRESGADRYLLRHETASRRHYERLHPPEMSFDNRMKCLRQLKELGYQVGCGFMVGSPYQTEQDIVRDLRFIQSFRPHMVGIGPYLTHKDTPFCDMENGSLDMTLKCLAIIRLLLPHTLIPATTALGTVKSGGREMGILSGANVIMPNLSPVSVRKKYSLYDNKICMGDEAAECRSCIERRVNSIGCGIVTDRGDYKE